MSGVVNVGGGESRGGECRTISCWQSGKLFWQVKSDYPAERSAEGPSENMSVFFPPELVTSRRSILDPK